MKPDTQPKIVAGGGWCEVQGEGLPRARFFGLVSGIWLVVSIGASIPFWNGWPESFGWFEWLCALLVVLQVMFGGLAVYFWLSDRPEVISRERSNPDCDIQKLY